MQLHARFIQLPITAIRPEGWLRRYLENQRDGLTGHMEAAGYPFDTGAWMDPEIKSHSSPAGWWPYEQTAYWIDGLVRCGYLLGDETLIARGRAQIDYVLEHSDEDGYLGPAFMKEPEGRNRWPHAIFFRALAAHYDATGDERIVPALSRHYLSGTSPHSDGREVCNVEMALWAYEHSSDQRLLEHALHAYAEYNQRFAGEDCTLDQLLSDRPASIHGVTFNQVAKLGSILYRYTGETRYLEASVNGYQKLDRDQMLVDGIPSSTEALRGKDPLDSHETCDIADYTWSVGHLLLTTGLADYADKIERACFNAAPGAVRKDFKALQYFSCPNQVIADATSNHNLFMRGRALMAYRPNPGVECCPGQVNRIMPNYAARMWLRRCTGLEMAKPHELTFSLREPGRKSNRLAPYIVPHGLALSLGGPVSEPEIMPDGDDGLVAALYGPSQVTARVGAGEVPVTIREKTAYPFSDRIVFEVEPSEPVAFTLWLRVPGWCRAAHLRVNGESFTDALPSGSFIPLRRTFAPGDRVELLLPMEIRLRRWPQEGISVERGPLVFALDVKEDWQVDPSDPRQTDDFPAWNLYPASRWNYALVVEDARETASISEGGLLPEGAHLAEVEVVEKDASDDPWSLEAAPVELRVKGAAGERLGIGQA